MTRKFTSKDTERLARFAQWLNHGRFALGEGARPDLLEAMVEERWEDIAGQYLKESLAATPRRRYQNSDYYYIVTVTAVSGFVSGLFQPHPFGGAAFGLLLGLLIGTIAAMLAAAYYGDLTA